jgi:hypothetical protein
MPFEIPASTPGPGIEANLASKIVAPLPKASETLSKPPKFETMNPENPEHVKAAKIFDKQSADDGELNEDNEAKKLKDDEHFRWTHPGVGDNNPWLGLSLTRNSESGKLCGFTNAVKLEPHHTTELINRGIIKAGDQGREVNAWMQEGSKKMKESALGQYTEEQLKNENVKYVTYWSSPGEKKMLQRLGYEKAYSGPYGEHDAEMSECYIRMKSENARADLNKMAAGKISE